MILYRRNAYCTIIPILLAGCGSEIGTKSRADDSNTSATATTMSSQPNPVSTKQAAVADKPGPLYIARIAVDVGVPEALQSGRLLIIDNCLVIDSGGAKTLALIPMGTDFDVRGKRLVNNRATVLLGREFKFGGGFYPASHQIFRSLTHTVPGRCPQQGTLVGEIL